MDTDNDGSYTAAGRPRAERSRTRHVTRRKRQFRPGQQLRLLETMGGRARHPYRARRPRLDAQPRGLTSVTVAVSPVRGDRSLQAVTSPPRLPATSTPPAVERPVPIVLMAGPPSSRA